MSNTIEGVIDGGFWINKQNEKGVLFMGVLIAIAPNRGAIVIATNTFSQQLLIAKQESHLNGFVSPDEGEYEINVIFRIKQKL